MAWRDFWESARDRLRGRYRRGRKRMRRGGERAGQAVRSLLDTFNDEWIERAFRVARQKQAPALEELPVDFQLRQHSLPRRIYERTFPVAYVMRMNFRQGREFLEDYMPISPRDYLGRGSYKFVYRLPWQMVVKVGKEILPSDPLIGSLFREVADNRDTFLSQEELELWEHLARGKSKRQKERIAFKFYRLGLERYSYWKVREELPDLVLPTRFFMGVRYRRRLMEHMYSRKVTPMDSQVLLIGKHLKEFAERGHRSRQGVLSGNLFPRYEFEFDIGRFGQVKKKTLEKIAQDFRRLIRFTQRLAKHEKLILDIHTENLIITLPDFQLKLFDFHLFDEHLYEPTQQIDRPENDHIEVIERFIESFDLDEDRISV